MPETLKLLSDVPDKSRDEEFIKQIQNQLEGSVEKNTAFIGLQGKWGSGKSTLIRSLTGCYTQYIFSMWSSNSQHLRRDFLVGLAEKIGLKKAAEKIALGQDLPPTNGCQKCWSRIVCCISWILFALFIFGMWVSISEVFYNLLNASPFYSEFTDAFKWVCLIGLSLLTVFIFLIYSKCDISGIFSIFGFTAAEPSADLSDMQFEKYFCQLIEQNPKTLLIVPDNVDRMLQGQAEAGICFLYLLKDIVDKYQQGEKGYNQPKQKAIILVPYDKKALLRIFANILHLKTEPEINQGKNSSGNLSNDGKIATLSKQGLVRLFPKKLDMPLIDILEAQKFLYEKLAEAGFITEPPPTDKEWVIMDKLYSKALSFFTEEGINIKPQRVDFSAIQYYLGSLFDEIPKTINNNWVGKLTACTLSSSGRNYNGINSVEDLYNALCTEILLEYNTLISTPNNTDFKRTTWLFQYRVIFVCINSALQTNKGLYIYRETIIFINDMVNYLRALDPILKDKKASNYDKIILSACYCWCTDLTSDKPLRVHVIKAYKEIPHSQLINPAYEE